MALLHISQLIRSEGFERITSRCDRITILGDYPTDASMISPNSYGHTDLTSVNFERLTGADDEIIVRVKDIPAIDVLLDELDLKYIALHSKTNLNYWLVFSVKSTAYNKGEGVVLPDFNISLKLNDVEQHLSPDMIWQGYGDFSTRCGRVMLCAGVPKTRTEVSNMHLGTKNLTPADFEQVGAGDDSRMMLKEQRMPAATKAGRIQSVAMLERTASNNFAVSRISNPIDVGVGAIVDVNGVGFKIEQGAGSGHDPRTKPTAQVKIDPANSLTRDLLYYTLDFKTEMVNNYDMPHVGTDIQWDANSKNVSFISTETKTKHNHIQLGSAIDDGNLLGQEVTIIFKFKQPNNVGTKGTLLTNFNDADDGHLEIDLPDGLGDAAFWAGTWGAASLTSAQLSAWHTYAFTRGDDSDNDEDVYIDGVAKGHADNAAPRRMSNQFFRIGGFDILQGTTETEYASFLGDLEYFAMWKRKLSAAEIATFSEKPYEILIDKEKVDKPTGYQAVDITKRFAENLIYYTSSWLDDIASNRPIYPESQGGVKKATIDPVSQNLLFDADFDQTQMVNFGESNRLSSDKFTISIRLKLHSTARTKTLDHALWGFRSASSTNHVDAKITGTEAAGYKIIFSIGNYSVSTDVAWNLLSSFKTWTFTYNSNDRIVIYRNSTKMVEKDIGARRSASVGAIRIGYNMPPMQKAFPGEVEYVAVWNDTFNSVHLHDFLQYPYAHLKAAELMDKKPLGKGALNRELPINNDLGTYVMDGRNEVVRNRSLQVVGKGSLPPEVDFIDRNTVFKLRTSEISGSYNTPAYITGYRTGNEPQVANRTALFRCKLHPKPSGAPAAVHPNHSTLFCCADTDAYEHRWHVYYGGFGDPAPIIVFEFGRTWLKHPFPVADAVNYHNFAFVQEYSYSGTTEYITLSIWIDGEKVASKKEANRSPVSVYELDFRLGGYKDAIVSGGKPADYSRFKGTVESYGVWDRALSEAEIKKLHREPYCSLIRNLVDKPNPNTYNISIASSDLTRNLFFYTLDFKNELVNNYWMEKVGVDIRYIYATSNVYFDSNINNNRIFLMPPTPGYDYQPKYEITILWRARRIDSEASWAGNYFCCPNRRGSTERISSHVCRPDGDNLDFIVDPGDITKNRLRGTFPHGGNPDGFFTMALRITNLGNRRWRYQSFARGNMVDEAVHPSPIPLFENWRMAIGGWERTSNYQGAKMEMEYFAFWARALSDTELEYVTENPYALVEIAPKALIDPTITVIDPEEEA